MRGSGTSSATGKDGYDHHYGYRVSVEAAPQELFSYVDDQARLSSHMGQSSWKMGGGKMAIAFDSANGKRVGAQMRLSGQVMGLQLSLTEAVIERSPPYRKTWETIGEPTLLVIGRYRMGFDITPQGAGSLLNVFIDYDFPRSNRWRWLGVLLGPYYARWCSQQMANGAARHFSPHH